MAAELGPDHEITKSLALRGKKPNGQSVGIHGILLTYRDGMKGTVLRVGDGGIRWNFACKLAGRDDPLATNIYVGPWDNRNLFKALSHAIQTHFRQHQAPYPVERTLLTSCTLDAAMDSRAAGGRDLETPQLAIAYEPKDFSAMREMGETWKIITPGIPEPKGLDQLPAAVRA